MMKSILYTLFGITVFMSVFACSVFAQSSSDLSISPSSVHFSKEVFLEGNPVRIYAIVQNNSNKDLRGTVQFYDESAQKQIGSDQTISILANKTDDVFIDWTPYFAGDHSILILIDPWNGSGDDPSNNSVRKTVNVLKDTDADGITDSEDSDDDNDGVTDEEDEFPIDAKEWVDTDGDRKGDNSDDDDDNDSKPDSEDAFPLNPLEWADSDKDEIGDNSDDDDDNDGLKDEKEGELGTDPINSDTDGDGKKDGEDAFPLNNLEWADFDKDGIGDNEDKDDDNDEIPDESDSHPNNKGPVIVINGNTSFAFLNRNITLDASDSFDEDGQIEAIHWTAGEEKQLGEKFVYFVDKKDIINLSAAIIDNSGEIREMDFNIMVLDVDFYLAGAMILAIIVLAIMIFLKYSSRA